MWRRCTCNAVCLLLTYDCCIVHIPRLRVTSLVFYLPNAPSRGIVVQHSISVQPRHDWWCHCDVTHDARQLNGALCLIVLIVQWASLLVNDHHLRSCGQNTWLRQAPRSLAASTAYQLKLCSHSDPSPCNMVP